MNRERKACGAKYFQAKVEHLKAFTERSYATKSLQHLYGPSDDITLANIINKAFLSPMRSFTPLPADYVTLPTTSATQQHALVVSNELVYKKLMKLNRSKAHGPDDIPGWLLKENADLLAAPIADILNSSYREGRLPPSWKEADRCCAGAQAKTCAGHKQTPSTHLPDTNPVKDSGRVRCRHLCQACCPLKDRPTAISNGAQLQHHACINPYDSLLGEVNGWKWIDYESCTL